VSRPEPDILEFRRISKAFGGRRALDGVSFGVRAGEVHVLAGENGAGKSTLIRVLSGAYADYDGELRLFGSRVHFRDPEQAMRAGIATIHQELSLIGALSIADNLLLATPGRAWSRVARRAERERCQRLLDELELGIRAETRVESLAPSLQQQIEIARALQRNAKVLVMDEATSSLDEREAERLFRRVHQLREQGCAIIYISHRMEEIFRLADRITVLRDGRQILTAERGALDAEGLVRAMLGQQPKTPPQRQSGELGTQLLEVRDLCLSDSARPGRLRLDRVSFSLRRGEILGIAGLAGSGASELLHALFGSYGPPESGALHLGGERFAPSGPDVALARGVALLASDRRRSLIGDLGIADNVSLSSLGRWSRLGWIRRQAELDAVRELLARLRFADKARSLRSRAGALSGGNQQKLLLGRCLMAEPRLVLLDEPTRGIDVGAKADVYTTIRALAARGLGVLLVASELEELLALAHRILVLQRGRVCDEIARAEFSRERVLGSAMAGARG
jgi:ribose transport system ATP-binding protein